MSMSTCVMILQKNSHTTRINQLAAMIIGEAVGDILPDDDDNNGKNPAADALGRLGGKKGGKARTEMLTPEQRKKIAQKVASARWKKSWLPV